jgi:hypothetical protein
MISVWGRNASSVGSVRLPRQWSRLFGTALLLWAGALAPLGGAAAAGLPGLASFLDSDEGITLLQTTRGRALMERLIGRPLQGAGDLGDLHAYLDQQAALPLNRRLESNVEKISEELRVRTGGRGLAVLARAEREILLEEISSRYLDVDALVPTPGKFEAARVRFLQGEFEAAIPIEKGSLEDRLAPDQKIWSRLMAIEKKYLRNLGLGRPEQIAAIVRERLGVRTAEVPQMMDYIFATRRQMAAELKATAALYQRSEPFLAESLEKAAKLIHVSDATAAKFAQKLKESAINWRNIPGASSEEIPGALAQLRGELGELKVSVRLAGVEARGLTVKQLGRFFPKDAVGDAARAELEIMTKEHPEMLLKELDLIMNQGTEWAEVKNYGKPLDRGHQFHDKVLLQARKTVRIKEYLETDPAVSEAFREMGKSIQLRIYLVAGVSEDVAQELEALGFQVFGPRIPVGTPAEIPRAS